MKKYIFLIAFIASSFFASAQSYQGEQGTLFQIGYQSNYNRFLLGAQYRYAFVDNFRVAPDITLFFPKNKITGLDFNINFHYVYDIDYQLSVYPLAGLNMTNNRFSGRTTSNGEKIPSKGWTDWGFNLGGGVSYNLYGGASFINIEAKYVFNSTDSFVFGLGYGFRF